MSTGATLTFIVLIIFIALAAYAVLARRRHLRLKRACMDAFMRSYASTLPVPAYEMAYSYGEPVFQVMFASRADMQAATEANAEFLRAIGLACADRGRRRPFKAERAVFFQHPATGEPAVTHCCATMRAQVGKTIGYAKEAKAYGLKTSSVGTPAVPIARCPWCGSTLPPDAAASP